jgi:hypothetical protein
VGTRLRAVPSHNDHGARDSLRIEIACVGEWWVQVSKDVITKRHVSPASRSLAGFHPEFVRMVGSFKVYSIDDPSAMQNTQKPKNDILVKVEFTDANMISSVNTMARDWAAEHAGESLRDVNDSTREKIRQIVTQAFAEATPYAEIVEAIRVSGAFSEARAALITKTETSMAQVKAQFNVWKESGLVLSVKWIAVGHDPCEVCLGNNGKIVKFGDAFPSGDISPLAHPGCDCILSAVKIKGLKD